jgi:hypothetical protein
VEFIAFSPNASVFLPIYQLPQLKIPFVAVCAVGVILLVDGECVVFVKKEVAVLVNIALILLIEAAVLIAVVAWRKQ